MPPSLILARELYTFLIGYYSKSKECLEIIKGLNQTHYHNIHIKLIGLVRSFSRRRNISLSRKHYCYIVIGTEFKEKLEQLTLEQAFCCVSINSGLKTFVLSFSLRTPDPYLLLKSPRPLCLPRGPQTSYQPA